MALPYFSGLGDILWGVGRGMASSGDARQGGVPIDLYNQIMAQQQQALLDRQRQQTATEAMMRQLEAEIRYQQAAREINPPLYVNTHQECFSTWATSFGQGFASAAETDPKKQKKAENKAILLLQNMIGVAECDLYRQFYRISLKPAKFMWIIGNVFDSFRKDRPFRRGPDVVRIDNEKKCHVTSFCVDQAGNGGQTPYTDKVIAFCSHLINDEKAFVSKINRIREITWQKLPKAATWEV